MMNDSPQIFTVSVPVKPYVKRYLEINYGIQVNFSDDPVCHRFFQQLLCKPNILRNKFYPDYMAIYSETVEVTISAHDFYGYGWGFTKTNIVF